MSGPALVARDHLVDGLFVREISPALPNGPATPLLMVHGAQHGWWAWEPWLELFAAAGWRCFAMSLRNHTGSRNVPPAEYLRLTVADYVDDVCAVVRWLGREPVVFAHSMGGIVAQKAAERLELAGLVLVASVGPGQFGKLREPLPADAPMHFDAATARAMWFREIDDDALTAFQARLVPESPGVINDYGGGGVPVARERITCPVLVVGGSEDATPVPRAPRTAAFYGAACLEIAGASHNMMMESLSLPIAMRINAWLLDTIDGLPVPRPTQGA